MSLSPIPIRVLHKVCVLPVSLRFLGQNDRLAAYASQMLQSIFPAQIFGSGLLCMSRKCLEGKKNTKNTNTPSTPKNNPPPKKTHNSPPDNQTASYTGSLKDSKHTAVCLL